MLTLKLKNTSFINVNAILDKQYIKKITAANKFPFGKQDFQYFIGFKDSEKIRPLCIFHPQMIICKIYFDENRHIYFLLKKQKVLLNIKKF